MSCAIRKDKERSFFCPLLSVQSRGIKELLAPSSNLFSQSVVGLATFFLSLFLYLFIFPPVSISVDSSRIMNTNLWRSRAVLGGGERVTCLQESSHGLANCRNSPRILKRSNYGTPFSPLLSISFFPDILQPYIPSTFLQKKFPKL
jgi:hypothetical protein